MKGKKKGKAAQSASTAAIGETGYVQHPEFRAFTQGRMPFPHEIDFWSMRDAEPWLYEYQLELQEEIDALGKDLSEAIKELEMLRMPTDCHADEKAIALLLSISKGRLVQDIYEAMQTAMFDMAQRLDKDEKWSVAAKITMTPNAHDDNKADVVGEVKVTIPAVVTGGSLYVDGSGNLLTPAEAAKQLSLFKFGAKLTMEAA